MQTSPALNTAINTSGVRVWAATDRWQAVAVFLFGLFVLYGVGFSTLPAAHNATHDTRHANGFPCH
ncbi:MAG TPA: CbtB domain-containing protein [Bryobacteraceae bacterium]|nr:CbtB domain-containing protein [Bryobacteraceae bacterium]